MITSVRMVNFKNFADETLKLGPFTVIVGANASGKSNIRDAFRFLHGISRGYTLASIIGGEIGPGGEPVWEPIRGAPNEVFRFEKAYPNSMYKFSIETELVLEEQKVYYSITAGFNPLSPEGFRVLEEELKTGTDPVYTTMKDTGGHVIQVQVGDGAEPSAQLRLNREQPCLTQILRSGLILEQPFGWVWRSDSTFGAMRFPELSPKLMREPSQPRREPLGSYGQGLPSALESICADPDLKRNLMSWVQELTPMDVKDFEFPRDPSGRVHLIIVESDGRKVSAHSISDGTLRFLGILAALLVPNEGGLYFFEEIENGIHPSRLWLLLDFIEQQTAKGNIQVITTTHSPALLAWMSDATFEHTSVVYRDEYWADSVIRPIAGLYNLRELRDSQGLERLMTRGWLETAMKFSEGDSDTEHLDDDEDDQEDEVLQ